MEGLKNKDHVVNYNKKGNPIDPKYGSSRIMQNANDLGNFWTANVVRRFLYSNWNKIKNADRQMYD